MLRHIVSVPLFLVFRLVRLLSLCSVLTSYPEKSRRFASRVCDQRLFLGKFQFEFLAQELSQLLLDFLCL